MEPLESYSQKYPQNLSKTEVELFSVNIKLLLRGSILGSNFYMFDKLGLSALSEKKNNNVIAILENILSSREFTYCENLIFGALELHFQARKPKCSITFLKIFVRALHFWIKR